MILPDLMRTPTLLDRLDLHLLRVAKRRRTPYTQDATFYDGFFDDRDSEKYTLDVRARWRMKLVREAFDRARPQGGGEVVDIGCGLGTSLTVLPPDVTYVGFDLSSETLGRARAMHGTAVDFRRGSLPDLPVDDGTFDLAICLEVLEHLEDDVAAVAEIRRVLRDGGHLVVSVPRTYYWPEYERLIGHYRHYDAASLDRLLREGGFEIVARLPQQLLLWRGYHYVYVGMRGFEALVRRAGFRSASMYEVGAYRVLARIVMAIAERLRSRVDRRSTFVLCRTLER